MKIQLLSGLTIASCLALASPSSFGAGLHPYPINVCLKSQGMKALLEKELNRPCYEISQATLDRLERLYVDNISELQRDDFEGLGELKILTLAKTSIKTLPEGLFAPLGKLETFYIYENANLEAFREDTFSGLKSLKSIAIWDNARLQALPELLFLGLKALEGIHIDGNGFSTLPQDLFRGLPSLRTIAISEHNPQFQLPTGIFHGLTRLWSLSLYTSTDIQDGLFVGLPQLRRLYVGSWQATQIPAQIFKHVPLIEELGVQAPKAHTLPAELFLGLSNVRELTLRAVSEEGSYPPNLLDPLLNLKFANIHVETDDFPSDSLRGLKRIERLWLTFSPKKTTVASELFDGLETLKHLYFNPMGWSALPNGFFKGVPDLQELSLGHWNAMPLTVSQQTLDDLTHLKLLDLENNVTVIEP